MMIVILIFCIVMAVSLPLFVSAMNDAKTKQCLGEHECDRQF